MWTTVLEWAKYAGVALLIGLIWLVSYCVFHGDDVKTKTKTVYFVVLSELVAAGIALLGWLCFRQGNASGAISVTPVVSLAFTRLLVLPSKHSMIFAFALPFIP